MLGQPSLRPGLRQTLSEVLLLALLWAVAAGLLTAARLIDGFLATGW